MFPTSRRPTVDMRRRTSSTWAGTALLTDVGRTLVCLLHVRAGDVAVRCPVPGIGARDLDCRHTRQATRDHGRPVRITLRLIDLLRARASAGGDRLLAARARVDIPWAPSPASRARDRRPCGNTPGDEKAGVRRASWSLVRAQLKHPL